MARITPVLSLVACLGCAALSEEEAPPPPLAPGDGVVLRAAELARVRCLLLAPFENASDAAVAADAATNALVAGVDHARTRVFPISELRATFRDTPIELPQGIAPSLATSWPSSSAPTRPCTEPSRGAWTTRAASSSPCASR